MAGAPEKSDQAEGTKNQVRHPARVFGGNAVALGCRLGEEHRDVVGENHPDPDDEAAELAVLGDAQAERQRDDAKDEACDRDRELGVNRHDLVVRRFLAAHLVGDVFAQAVDGLFGEAAGEIHRRKHRIGIQPDDDLLELPDARHPRARRRVVDSVVQDQLDRPLGWIQDDSAVSGHVGFDRVRLAGIGEEHVLPSRLAWRRLVPRVQHPVREILKEDARLDIALDLLAEGGKKDLAVTLVRVRNRLDHHVHGGGHGDAREDEHWTKQPVGADAARQERDRLTVRREPAQAYQQADQQSHRDRQPEGLRAQQQDDAADRRPRDTLGQELLELLHHGRQFEDKREDQQRQDERRNDFTNDVAVDRLQHQLSGVPA